MTKKLNKTLLQLVNILNDSQYHDGTHLGDQLKITRSAVWKNIKKLQSYDVRIDAVKGRGYLMPTALHLLDAEEIIKQLSEKVIVEIFESMTSTNDYLKNIKQPQTRICLAEQQTQGRGRLNREWHSPFGKNIYLSCLFAFEKDISALAGLSMVTSLAIVKALNSCSIDQDLVVKWPNDILYQKQKLAGSLIEVQAETHNVSYAIVGVGINVNMQQASGISQAWTSMSRILGQQVNRNKVCVQVINHLLAYFAKFNEQGFAPFIDEWMQADCLMNQSIQLRNLDKIVNGKMCGINEQGYLLLQLEDGSIKAFSSGDTSIAK